MADQPTVESVTGKSSDQILKNSQDYAAGATQTAKSILGDLQGTDIQSFSDWLTGKGLDYTDPTQTDAYGGLTSLADKLSSGPSAQDLQGASDYAGQNFGMTGDQLSTTMGDLTNQMTAGPEAMQGMSPEEYALRQREIRNTIRGSQTQAAQMIDTIMGETGSRARALQAADQQLSSINDSEVKQQVALADEAYNRKLAQYQGIQNTWNTMLQSKQVSESAYLTNISNMQSQALQAYATQINTTLARNQQYLSMYSADEKAVMDHAGIMYEAANLSLGISKAEVDIAHSYYEEQMAPYYDALKAWEIEEANKPNILGAILGGLEAIGGAIMTIASAGTLATPGVALIAGGVGTFAKSM